MSPAQQPMARVCARLQALGTDLGACRALEFFAREGDWHATVYAPKVARLDAWEIDPACEEALRRNLPRAQIRIGDSYRFAAEPEFAGRFDLIVYDNPQLLFGADDRYCEHFEAIDTARALGKTSLVVIFNVNMAPFDYERWHVWQERRNRFYHIRDASRLEEAFILDFYRQYFCERGLAMHDAFLEPRYNSPICYLVGTLRRNGD